VTSFLPSATTVRYEFDESTQYRKGFFKVACVSIAERRHVERVFTVWIGFTKSSEICKRTIELAGNDSDNDVDEDSVSTILSTEEHAP
jgi:hypothetical protein